MRFFGCVGSAAVAAASVIPFFVFPASAVGSTVTLTTAQTVALFGQTIDCEYLSTDGTYKPITATYAGNVAITGGEYFSPDGQTFEGRSFIQYSLPYKSDMQTAPADITIYFKTAVDLSSVAYVDSALVQLSNMSFGTQILGTYTDYWYTSAGYFYPLAQDDTEPGSYLYGRVWNDPSYSYTVIPAFYNGEASTFSTGWAKCGSFKDTTYANDYYIGIVCPILSDSYQFDGNNGAGAGSGESSGGGSDSGSDISGIVSRLDTIISKLDQIVFNTANGGTSEDSSQNANDQAAVNSMAADQSSKYDQANSYQDNVYDIADLEDVSLPDLENSYTDIPSDFSKFWYIDGQATIFVTMLLLTTGVAVVAFIIFGKTF